MLPAEYTARCTESHCTWRTSVTALPGNPDPREYRDELAKRHANNYGHVVVTHDYE